MSFAAASTSIDLGDEQLEMLMQQLHTHAGIKIDSTGGVITACVRERMEYLGVSHMSNYLAAFEKGINGRAEWLALLDLLTVKETRFFRQAKAYEYLHGYLGELLAKGPVQKELSFWSAGCSNGQELYSMAMVVESVLANHQPWLQWHGIGTDISFRAINHGQQGVYTEAALKSLPENYREAFMELKLGGRRKVCDDIKSRTHFFHSNLLHVDSTPFADFNIIFCQNVLIYFEREKQRWIIDQLVERLRPAGLLILGAGEDAGWSSNTVRRLDWPGVCAYEKTGG